MASYFLDHDLKEETKVRRSNEQVDVEDFMLGSIARTSEQTNVTSALEYIYISTF